MWNQILCIAGKTTGERVSYCIKGQEERRVLATQCEGAGITLHTHKGLARKGDV